MTRQRGYSSDWRKEAGGELDEPLSVEACLLAAPLERCEPEPLHPVEEPPQAREVNPVAYRIAGMLGQHVGEGQLRRRARTIQDLLRAAGPLTGIAASAGASIYAGLKGIFGW